MSDPVYILKVVVKTVALPPIGPLLVALTALVAFRQSRQVGRSIAILCIGCVVALATPLASSLLVRLLDSSPAYDPHVPSSAQAIVILGGGIRRDAVEYGGDTLAHLSVERVRYGAKLARVTGLPVLVSGGSPTGGSSEADLMKSALTTEYGIAPRWTETDSRNTYENARNSATILRADRVTRILLVVHSFDVPRARREFARWGIDAVPAPTGIPPARVDLPSDIIPGIAAMQVSYFACYELLALLASRLHDIIPPANAMRHAAQ